MKESTARRRIMEILKRNKVPAVPVENVAYKGTPDICYSKGWIELKCLNSEAWPQNENAYVRVDHFEDQQRLFLSKWTSLGGRAYVILTIGTIWFLLDGEYAWKNLGNSTAKDLQRNAIHWAPSGFDEEKFIEAICG